MTNELEGRVALITGAARGQGRSHALRLARQGADIIALDIARQLSTVPYPMSSVGDLNETVQLVEATGRACLPVVADVANTEEVEAAIADGIDRFGHVDILLANAGIVSFAELVNISDAMWDEMLATNLTGAFRCARAVVPHMAAAGWGRIIMTSSMAGRGGWQQLAHYSASKWGMIGLAKSLAMEVAPLGVTVNVLCPSSVNTPMMHNDFAYRLFRPDLENPTVADALPAFQAVNVQQVPYVEPDDISDAVSFLVSEDARYITGATLSVAAGVNALNV
jgi:SDR family mycofactocin-dependent oxidoreductase